MVSQLFVFVRSTKGETGEDSVTLRGLRNMQGYVEGKLVHSWSKVTSEELLSSSSVFLVKHKSKSEDCNRHIKKPYKSTTFFTCDLQNNLYDCSTMTHMDIFQI